MRFNSCWWLQDHIGFGLDDVLQVCCYTFVDSHGKPRGAVELCRVLDNRFPAEAVRAARARIHAEIAADANANCRECHFLTLKDWEPRLYLAKFVTINVWSHCNLRCVYCFTTAPGVEYSKVSYSVPAVIADMLEGGHLDPSGNVTWGGDDISHCPSSTQCQLFIDCGSHRVSRRALTNASAALPCDGKGGTVEVALTPALGDAPPTRADA